MKCIALTCLTALAFSTATAQTTSPDARTIASVDSSELYGLIPQRPIKVGGNFTNGVANQRKYLRAIRDAQGQAISYQRLGSCCGYPTKNGFDGYGLLDKYEVTYRDKDNVEQKVVFYISFYDFEEPKAVKGFTLDN